MNMNNTDSLYVEMKSPYRRGAEDGFAFGAYIAAIMFGSIFATRLPLVGLLSSVLMVLVPVWVYVRERRYLRAEGGLASVSALWMQGIMMFGCGSVIAFSLVLIYMKWIDPGYLNHALADAVSVLQASGSADARELADEMSKILENGNPLTPVTYCFGMIWSTMLSGSILSLLLAFIARAVPLRRGNRELK